MSIIASCGHEISLDWHMNEKSGICYIEYPQMEDESPRIYAVVCEKCRKWYEENNLIVENN